MACQVENCPFIGMEFNTPLPEGYPAGESRNPCAARTRILAAAGYVAIKGGSSSEEIKAARQEKDSIIADGCIFPSHAVLTYQGVIRATESE